MSTSYTTIETSIEDGTPCELYKFVYDSQIYLYTSSEITINAVIDNSPYMFNPEYIKRSDSLDLSTSGGSTETCTIDVVRTNPIALLYQGSPPELNKVKISVYSYHDASNIIKILQGTVSQVRCSGSTAILTITIENILNRTIPRGTLSYYCQNQIYDNKCKLNAADYALKCTIDGGYDGLWIYSSTLATKDSGYFTNGYIKMGNSYRSVLIHENNGIKLRYPVNESDKTGSFTIYPGCNGLFMTCHKIFSNTDNFSGVPYTPPMDSVKHRVATGQYWVNSNVIVRDTNGAIGTITI